MKLTTQNYYSTGTLGVIQSEICECVLVGMYIDGVETARVETSKNIGQIVSQLEGHLRIKTQILE